MKGCMWQFVKMYSMYYSNMFLQNQDNIVVGDSQAGINLSANDSSVSMQRSSSLSIPDSKVVNITVRVIYEQKISVYTIPIEKFVSGEERTDAVEVWNFP